MQLSIYLQKGLSLIIIIFFTQIVSAQYCTPTSNCTVGDGIIFFGLETFSNSSGCEASNDVPGYADFTNLTGLEVSKGETYDLQLESSYSNQKVSIWIDVDNSETFEVTELVITDVLVEYDLITVPFTVPLSFPEGTYRLRVQANYSSPSSVDACSTTGYGETEDYIITILPVISCHPTTYITLLEKEINEVKLTWYNPLDISFFDIEIGEVGFTPTGLPTQGYENVSAPLDVANLIGGQEYDLYIRSDCNGDDSYISNFVGPFSFSTHCDPLSSTIYVQEFFIATDADDNLPECWSEAIGGTALNGVSEYKESEWTQTTLLGNTKDRLALYFDNNESTDWAVSPYFQIEGSGEKLLSFKMAMREQTTLNPVPLIEDDEFHLLVKKQSTGTWEVLSSWEEGDLLIEQFGELTYSLNDYIGEAVQFAFLGIEGAMNTNEDLRYILIDDFIVYENEYCGAPNNVTVSEMSGSYASITWEGPIAGMSYDVEFIDDFLGQMGVPEFTVDIPEITFVNLEPDTDYKYYLRAYCGDEGFGLWTGPYSFTTPCIFDLEFEENFSSSSFAPDCWREASGSNIFSGPPTIQFEDWNFLVSVAECPVNVFTNTWLVSPQIDLSSVNNAELEIKIKLSSFSGGGVGNPTSLGADDRVDLVVTNTNGAPISIIDTWTEDTPISDVGDIYTYELWPYLGMNFKLAFHVSSGEVANGVPYFSIDYVQVNEKEAPLNITGIPTSITCNGSNDGIATINIDSGNGDYTYEWSNGETLVAISGLAPATYTCTVTDALGLQDVVEVYIEEPTTITSSHSLTNESSLGANNGAIFVSIDGGVSPYIYEWSDGSTSANITDLSSGEYCLTLTDDVGCEREFCYDIGIVVVQELWNELTSISISPNPVFSTQTVQLDVTFAERQDVSIALVDIFGRKVNEQQFYFTSSINNAFDLSMLDAGVYFIRIQDLNSKKYIAEKVLVF